MLVTKVRDSGVGLRPEDLIKLLKYFGQLQSTSQIKQSEVGFELSVSKDIS